MALAISMANDYGPAIHPFFMPKNGLVPSEELDFDQNEGRRKRQKTTSPEPLPIVSNSFATSTWADQLNAAASSTLPAIDGTASDTTATLERVAPQGIGATGELIDGHPQTGSATGVAASVAENGPDNKDDGRCVGGDSNTRTPPKSTETMMRVRPDGRLGSPKAKAPIQGVRSKRGRKSAKAESFPLKLVALIKYGKDDESRLLVGRKINAILLRPDITYATIKNNSCNPTEPSKPTHPFFLGGPVLASSQHQRTASSDPKKHEPDASTPKDQRKITNPLKARVTSKPPDISNGQTREVAFGLGSNILGSNHIRMARFPGAVEPTWPPADMLHVGRPKEPLMRKTSALQGLRSVDTPRKLKSAEVRVLEEETVLGPYLNLVRTLRKEKEMFQSVNYPGWHLSRRPLRRLMTGRDLQKAIHPRLALRLDTIVDSDVDELNIPQPAPTPAHKALRRLYDSIATSFSAFDRFECETQDWVRKYAPRAAEEVLQQSHEVTLLREWLKGLTITSVECGEKACPKAGGSLLASKKRGGIGTKKKRKRAEELDGFVVSSDDEASLMGEVTDPEAPLSANFLPKRSVIRSGDAIGYLSSNARSTNAVVISGPHGCGKTSAVYAVAQELGFEVFEINAASRRSGRDILDRVGDMTRNHLVRQDPLDEVIPTDEAEAQQRASLQLEQDIESGRQGTMKSFFKPERGIKKKMIGDKPSAHEVGLRASNQPKKQQSQKQSLILLEEVDVLFEEDKLFWTTVLDLTLLSKRPIIMTCTNEGLLPLDDMVLYAIFRFGPPADQLAVDYLLLVACNEGHLLSRDAVSALYRAKRSDLRASIAELNFWCQMAIGDAKGGLEWMLIKSPSNDYEEGQSESMRVVSEDTYHSCMGYLSGESSVIDLAQSISQETELLSEAWNCWGIDIAAHEEYFSGTLLARSGEVCRERAIKELETFELAFESLSAADTYPASVSRSPEKILLETAPPILTEKTRSSYVEGSNVLQADPVIDQTGLSDSVAITVRTCARRLLDLGNPTIDAPPSGNQSMLKMVIEIIEGNRHGKAYANLSVKSAFEPISRSQKAVLGMPKGPQVSTFDGPMSVVAEDLAPYVRSIISHDIRLEEQRRKLSSLLSQPGKDSKKTRTTRASRAALEGGSKAHTRRERWFPNHPDFDAIMRTGGKGWQDVLLQHITAEIARNGTELDRSRRSSLASAMESDD